MAQTIPSVTILPAPKSCICRAFVIKGLLEVGLCHFFPY